MDKYVAHLTGWVVVATSCGTGAPEPSHDEAGNGTVTITEEQHNSNTLGGLVYEPSTGQFTPE